MPWQPRNKYCWDFWFAWKEQTLHIFFVQANQLACGYNPQKRHNFASVGHAILTDAGWKEISSNKPTFAPREGNFWDNLSIWTGSIIKKDDLYYFLYTGRRKEDPWITTPNQRRRPQNVGVAVSKDLNTWTRTPASLEKPVIPHPGTDSDFDGINWHDPYVIRDDTDGKYYAFICAHPKDTPADVGGVVAYTTSKDLENWQEEPYRILYKSDEFYLTEVPQVFWRRTNDQKHWCLYLIFSPRWSPFFNQKIPMGVTYYVRSMPIKDRREVSYDNIPWESEPANQLTVSSHAGKFINPEASVPVFLGFQYEDESGHFVGAISDPQWAVFEDDGKIRLCDEKVEVSTYS